MQLKANLFKKGTTVFTYHLHTFDKIIKIRFGLTIEANTAARIQFRGLQLARRFAVKRLQREVFLIYIDHFLTIMWIQMY